MRDGMTERGLAALARPSGTFAMVALDQRESLRAMLEAARGADPLPDDLGAFKVEAARALSPHASAVLLDLDTGLGPVRDADALAPGCGLIVAADRLTQARGGIVEGTDVDARPFADAGVASRADAFKLLVIWHPDRGRDERRAVVERFAAACRQARRPAVVEGIVRRPASVDPTSWDHPGRVLEAAVELSPDADLYKAEVPTLGRGAAAAIEAASRAMTDALACPWVVLSNGVAPEAFDAAVEAACRGGASGFLAGRAIWTASLAAHDTAEHLRTVAAPRLARLAELVDRVARPWTATREEDGR